MTYLSLFFYLHHLLKQNWNIIMLCFGDYIKNEIVSKYDLLGSSLELGKLSMYNIYRRFVILLWDLQVLHSGWKGIKKLDTIMSKQVTVLHFTSERLSPRFLPQNQIKFLLVKKFYFWLTASCLAIDKLETRNWKFSIFCLFSGHVFSIRKSHHRPIWKLQILSYDVLNIIFI